jgi:hypothetical protein
MCIDGNSAPLSVRYLNAQVRLHARKYFGRNAYRRLVDRSLAKRGRVCGLCKPPRRHVHSGLNLARLCSAQVSARARAGTLFAPRLIPDTDDRLVVPLHGTSALGWCHAKGGCTCSALSLQSHRD